MRPHEAGSVPPARPPHNPDPDPKPHAGQAVELSPVALPTAVRWGAAALMLAGLGLCLHLLRYALLPFVVAGGFTLLLSPLMRWLQQRWRWPHVLAASAVMVVLVLVLSLIGWGIRALLFPQLLGFAEHGPAAVDRMLHEKFPTGQIHIGSMDVPIDSFTHQAGQQLSTLVTAPNLALAVGGGFSALMGGFLVLLLTGYFLFTDRATARGIRWLVPPARRHQATRVAHQIVPMLRRYVLGILCVAAYATALAWGVMHFAMGLPEALVLAISVGLLEMLPVIGPILSLVLVGGAALLHNSSIGGLVGFGLFAIGLRLSIDQVIGPVILGRSTSLPPPVIIFAFLAGGILFGAVGVVLAVPAAAVVKIILTDVYESPPPETAQKNPPV